MKESKRLLGRHGGGASLVLLGVVVGSVLAEPVLSLQLKTPRNYNEDWNAHHAQRALGDEALYPPSDALISNNYPPLSFLLVGAIGAIGGDLIITGRWVALISLLSVAGLIGCIVNRLARDRLAASAAALIFLGYVGAHYPIYVAVNDPQWLAHAVMTAGLLVFCKAPRSPGRLAAAAVLMALAGFIKHNLIPLPAAVLVWMLLYERASLRVWLAAAVTSVLLGFAAAYLAYGPDFIAGLLMTPRRYGLLILVKNAAGRVSPLLPLVMLAVAFVYLERHRKDVVLIGLYAALALTWGMFVIGGEGINVNALFDLVIALAILFGLTLSWISKRARFADSGLSPTFAWQWTVVFATILFVAPIPEAVRSARTLIQERKTRIEESRKDVELLASKPDPVACESSALCYWAGKSFYLDFFNTGQKLSLGTIPMSSLVDPIKEGRLSLIHLSDSNPKSGSVLLPTRVNEAIRSGYQVIRTSPNGLFLAPASSKDGPR